ncbi:MAG: isochorismatase family protein [Rhizobiales bacterium]|nr:isochorismatase family protein [Hyphomicrobiales bacterium]
MLQAGSSLLLAIDFQGRLMPAIEAADDVVLNASRLARAAALLDVPTLWTEQNAAKLGGTVEALAPPADAVVHKMTFDATRAPDLMPRLPEGRTLVVIGCEAHVCVLQTVLGLIERGRSVAVVADAVGSRRRANKEAGLARMARAGAQIVTTEMVVFEWLESAEHPRFREVVALIK